MAQEQALLPLEVKNDESLNSLDLQNFLEEIRKANITKEKVYGAPALAHKEIRLERGVYVLESGYDKTDAYSGTISSIAYHVMEQEFEPILQNLQQDSVKFKLPAVEVKKSRSWDRSCDFDELSSATIIGGRLEGRLTLTGYALTTYRLKFKPARNCRVDLNNPSSEQIYKTARELYKKARSC